MVYDLAYCLLRLQNYCTSTQPDKDSKIDDRQTAKKKSIDTCIVQTTYLTKYPLITSMSCTEFLHNRTEIVNVKYFFIAASWKYV